VHTVTISASINSFPSATVKFHKEKSGGKASNVLSSELISSLAGFQRDMFKARTEPDLDLEIDDGNGGALHFKGYIANPGLVASYGDISADIKAIHTASVVEALNLSIYTAPGVPSNHAIKNVESASWSSRLSDITKELIKNWERAQNPSDENTVVQREIHKQNGIPLKVWNAMLSSSVDSTTQKSLGSAPTHPGVNTNINDFLANTLLAVKPGFMGTMLSLNGALQMLYAPGMTEDDPGKFVLTQNLFKDAKELRAEMNESGCSAGLGARSNLPLGQVLVMGVGGSNFATEKARKVGRAPGIPTLIPKTVVRYPKEGAAGGQLISVPLPPFLPSPVHTHDAPGLVRRVMNAEETAEQVQKSLEKTQAFVTGPFSDICRDYAHNIYIDLALSGAQFTINLPLDLTVRVGLYYNVSGPSASLFKGLLVRVVHTLSISETNASASSSLTFSYVEMNGFSLPNK